MHHVSKSAEKHGKLLLKKGLARLGLDLRRLPRRSESDGEGASSRETLPPIFDDPFEALHFMRGGRPASFHCPIAQTGLLNGLTFGCSGWNPFSSTAAQIQSNTEISYSDSILRNYYELWQPNDAAEAIIGLSIRPIALRDLPAHLYYFVPWQSRSIHAIDAAVWEWYVSDYQEHGFHALKIDVHGFKNHGPARPELGQAEIIRLNNIVSRLQASGYDRRQGDAAVWLLRRGRDIRFINRGGFHRMAAMDALGYETIPARFVGPAVVDIKDVDYWPQVRNGTWPRDEALRYFNHLFDFDAKGWAKEHGLL